MYDVKYAPYANEYMGMANGNAYEHLKRWLKRRLLFTDSLYDYAPSYADSLTIRANTTEPMTIEIETYAPVYQHMSWYNNQMDKKKIDGKTAVTFTGTAQASTDQEVIIYGGSNIKRIRGISTMNPNSMLIGNATKLVELECNNAPLLTDINSNKANLSPNVYLTKVDISNCPQLGGTLRLNNSPLLQEVNAQGTAITGMLLPTSIKNLQTLKVPRGVTELTLNDAKTLTTLDLEEGYLLETLSLSNCNKLKSFDLSKVKNITLDNSYSAEEIRLSTNQQVNLRNMGTLKRLAYTPNGESEEFDLATLKNSPDVTITSFNCPNLKEFITTAPQRISYGESDNNIYPYKLFMANKLDLSGLQVDTVKFLCTTDIFDLKLPNTLKNFYCDSAFDLDTTVVTDGDYDVIHSDLIRPYTEEYNENVYNAYKQVTESNMISHEDNANWNTGNVNGWYASEWIAVRPDSDVTTNFNNNGWYGLKGKTKNGEVRNIYRATNSGDLSVNNQHIPSDVYFIQYGGISTRSFDLTYEKPQTPNIIPTSANGSLLFNINQETPQQNAPYIWDLQGMKLNDFHTYGVNNKIDIDLLGNITMPKRLADYKVQIKNADITPNQYNTMLYPKLVDTTLPITGKLDYSKYKGKYLSWAFAYTTDDVVRTPLDSRSQGQIINDYNKLYSTDFIDIVDVWAYKDDDFSSRATNNNITKAYIELTQSNYQTRIDEVLQWYPNCTEVYLFEDGTVTTLEYMYSGGGHNNANGTRNQVQNVTFMEGYFNNLKNLFNGFISCYNLVTVNNIPKSVMNFRGCFESCEKLNQQFDFSSFNIVQDGLDSVLKNCLSLTHTPILPTNYTGILGNAFQNTKITTAPVLPDGITSLASAFRGCKELTTVGNIPTSCTNFERFVNDCPKITSVPQEGWKGNLSGTFWNVPLLNQQINIESATSLDNTFNACSSLSIAPQLPQNANCSMSACFRGTSLVTPPVTPNGVTTMFESYAGCTSLTSAPNIPSSCTNITSYLNGCNKITSVSVPLKNIFNYSQGLANCSAITDIDWTGKRTTDFSLTSLNCPSYTQEDLKELVNDNLEDLYKDKIKISFADSKVTINGTETTIQ